MNYSKNAIDYYFRFKYWRKKYISDMGPKIWLYRFEIFFKVQEVVEGGGRGLEKITNLQNTFIPKWERILHKKIVI